MIIALYESSYPVEPLGTPNWEELPGGYFIASEDDIRTAIEDLPEMIEGVFSFSKGTKPRIGEHVLAVFPLDGRRYLCDSTIIYKSEKDVVDRNEWAAQLGITNIISTW